MSDRPLIRFGAGVLFGFLASFSISFGPLAAIALFASLLLITVLNRRIELLAGGLFGWGLAWTVVIGSTYRNCQSMGSDCIGGEGMLPFIVIGALLAVVGAVTAVVTETRRRRVRAG
jgi:hypothetical protein